MRFALITSLLLFCQLSFAVECVDLFSQQPSQLTYLDRYNSFLDQSKKTMQSTENVDQLVENIMEQNVRIQFFFMQSLIRLGKNSIDNSDKESLKQLKYIIKGMEDAIGKYSLARTLAKVARKYELSKPLLSYIELKEFQARESFKQYLKENHWIDGNAYTNIKTLLTEVNWSSKKLDAESVIESTRHEIEELERQIIHELDPLLTQQKYDYRALEDGLHELRRELRWILLNIMSTHDLYHYAPINPTRLNFEDRELYESYKDNKYTKFPSDHVGPVQIPTLALFRLVRFINDLGKIKDYGEAVYFLTQAAKKLDYNDALSGQKTNLVEEVQRKLGQQSNIEEEALKTYKRLQRKKPLEELYRALSQNTLSLD